MTATRDGDARLPMNSPPGDAPRSYIVDSTWERIDRTAGPAAVDADGITVLGGSPLGVFTFATAARPLLEQLEAGHRVRPTRAEQRVIDRLLDCGAIHPIANRDLGPSRGDVTVVTPQLGGTARAGDRITIDDGSPVPVVGAQLRLPTNRGPAAARNAGRAIVDTPFIAFIDRDVSADVSAPHGWIERLLPHFDDPAVGLVAPRVRGESGSPLDLGPHPARIRSGTRVSYVPAAALIVRAAAFDSIGGFDEQLRVGEDVDLVWRLDDAGWRCRYDPAATVWHRPRPTRRAVLAQHAAYGTSAAPLALRHPGAVAPVRSNVWSVGAAALAASSQPVAAAIVAGGSAIALIPRLPQVPPRRALGLAIRGHVASIRQFADATWRVWWPVIIVAALASRRARRWALVAALVRPHRTSLLSDVAYGWGVWRGAVIHRTVDPLLPRLQAFPGRGARPSRRGATLPR
ncbi:MAG: glycosyltransferase [Actinomycetota bacterium]